MRPAKNITHFEACAPGIEIEQQQGSDHLGVIFPDDDQLARVSPFGQARHTRQPGDTILAGLPRGVGKKAGDLVIAVDVEQVVQVGVPDRADHQSRRRERTDFGETHGGGRRHREVPVYTHALTYGRRMRVERSDRCDRRRT